MIFDLFNEPRTCSAGTSQAWQLWLNGGRFQGVFYPFGMAALTNYVRNTLRAQNLFWMEGPGDSSSFAGMVTQHAQLKVSGVVYAVHHPAGPHDPDLVRRLRLPDHHGHRARGGRRMDQLRARADPGPDHAAQLLLAGCADNGSRRSCSTWPHTGWA